MICPQLHWLHLFATLYIGNYIICPLTIWTYMEGRKYPIPVSLGRERSCSSLVPVAAHLTDEGGSQRRPADVLPRRHGGLRRGVERGRRRDSGTATTPRRLQVRSHHLSLPICWELGLGILGIRPPVMNWLVGPLWSWFDLPHPCSSNCLLFLIWVQMRELG
jgi:hypothetical protein